MITIMPMAGRGSRFSGTAYQVPKPLIPLNGVPMFVHAIQSLINIDCSQLIFIGLKDHDVKYGLRDMIRKYVSLPSELILLDDVTEGQLSTTMTAKEYLATEEDILIISSDTVIKSNLGMDIRNKKSECRGIISVANMPGEQWSFARTDENGRVVEVAEKRRISNLASTGMYYFSSGNEFYSAAEEIVKSKQKTRGEYFVIQVYQKYLENGAYITVSKAEGMQDMGTPESLTTYMNSLVSNSLQNE